MFTIVFEYYNVKSGTYEKDTFECEASFNEFKIWIYDNGILNYEILEISPCND